MKFLLDINNAALNSEFVKNIYFSRIYDREQGTPPEPTNFFHVGAELSDDEPDKILKEFKSEDEAENFKAAKKYFNEVVNLLNQEITFIRTEGGRCVINIKFVRKLKIEQGFSGDAEFTQILAEIKDEIAEGTILKEFSDEFDDEFILDAKDYLAELVKTLNAEKINFIIYDEEESAINLAFVKNFTVAKNLKSDSFAVLAEPYDEDEEIILQEFDSGNKEQNFQAAEKYLAELVKTLNAQK